MKEEKHGKTSFCFKEDLSREVLISRGSDRIVVPAKDLISFVSERAKRDLVNRLEEFDWRTSDDATRLICAVAMGLMKSELPPRG